MVASYVRERERIFLCWLDNVERLQLRNVGVRGSSSRAPSRGCRDRQTQISLLLALVYSDEFDGILIDGEIDRYYGSFFAPYELSLVGQLDLVYARGRQGGGGDNLTR